MRNYKKTYENPGAPKGTIPWNKGKKRPPFSDEWRKKLGLASKGRILSSEHKKKISEALKGRVSPMKGRTLSEEHKKKLSIANKGRVSIGHPHTMEHRKYMSQLMQGAKNWQWKGGIKSENRRIRKSLEYRLWRTSVFTRDDYTCQICKVRGGRLEADHIKLFSTHPELRFDINNGRTLCKPCHLKTPTWGSHKGQGVSTTI